MPIQDDRFQNILPSEVVSSAANALTFAQVTTGASLGMRLGLIIDAINYMPATAALLEMTATGDRIITAWCTSDQLTDLEDEADSRILDQMIIMRHDVGTAATAFLFKTPIKHDFTPPLIMASPNLYLAVQTVGLASAATIRSRLSFRFITLSPQQYLEIAETFLHG